MLKEKIKGKKRKLYHFNELVNDFIYDDFKNLKLKNKENNYTFKGYAYRLENPKSDTLQEVYNKYDNTYIMKSYCQYAPELKYMWLFIEE